MTDPIVPMLCSPHKKVMPSVHDALHVLSQRGDYYFDLKLDGIRGVAYVVDGKAQIINRRMQDISVRYPEIIAGLEAAFPDVDCVLDGEIACFEPGTGRLSFKNAHHRDAQSKAPSPLLITAEPATYIAFDVLIWDGDDVRNIAYAGRRAMLKQMVTAHAEANLGSIASHPQLRVMVGETDGETMWQFVRSNQLEGLVAKRASSRYTGGRSIDWIKLKETFRVSAVVVGYSPGTGARAATFGALQLALIDEGAPWRWGEVGTGFTHSEIADLKARIDRGELLIIDIEVQNVTPDRRPRFPSYVGIRSDLTPADCSTGQLSTVPQL